MKCKWKKGRNMRRKQGKTYAMTKNFSGGWGIKKAEGKEGDFGEIFSDGTVRRLVKEKEDSTL
jgi:hypothetical protein